MKRLFLTLAVALSVAGPATDAAAAEDEGISKLRLDVPAPESVEGDVRAETRRLIAERLVKRIRKRLTAAGIKFTNVQVTEDATTIVVEADPDHDVQMLEGLVIPPGEFAVRAVQQVGRRWVEMTDEMPDGVELRTGEDALDRDDAYVWSESRRRLESFLADVEIPSADLAVYATGGGWRSVTLGDALATHEDVRSTEIRRVRTGAPFVAVELDPEAKAAFENIAKPKGLRFAAVLDGEVVSLMKPTALSEHLLSIPAPEYLSGFEALMGWARQVAGRLAARIPVQMVPLRE